MAKHERGTEDELKRAADRSAALLGARNASRRGAVDASERMRAADRQTLSDAARNQAEARRARGAEWSAGNRQSSNEAGRAGGASQSTGAFLRRNATYILSVVGVVVIAVLMIAFIRACAPQEEPESSQAEPWSYVSPYDWENLDHDNGRYTYSVNGTVVSRLGIDVSESQGSIDWQAVADDGIDFAMIRIGYRGLTEGSVFADDMFDDNFERARAAGIDCGVYFFSQANSVEEAVEEAEFVIDELDGAKLEYPIAFDSEAIFTENSAPRTSHLSIDEMTAIAQAFCDRVEKAGYRSMVYGNYSDMTRYHYADMQNRNIWWAQYGASQPSGQIDIFMWQYTDGGHVDGIDTFVDMDIDLSAVVKG